MQLTMAPSRGLLYLRSFLLASPNNKTRIRAFSSFSQTLSNPTNTVQSYISRSTDPYLNLALEDHILRTSPASSSVLFLYTNAPCVVIGRNQNPWYEVNLNILSAGRSARPLTTPRLPTGINRQIPHLITSINEKSLLETEPPAIGDVQLVRRRSGGGTVFHDLGNVNWSVVCPRDAFTRDKHAEMVVRALRGLGVERTRVNERHDIVLDQGAEKKLRDVDPRDTHTTTYTMDGGIRPLKVSGSAYKLTRGRALHHATTLLQSPNLNIIPDYLHSPAKPFLEAKGVESVSSPVGNIGVDTAVFQKRVQEEFAKMYSEEKELEVQTVGDEHLEIPEIRKGYEELRTKDWIWSQTPGFTLKLDPENTTRDDIKAHLTMNVHHGVIQSFEYKAADCPEEYVADARCVLVGQKLQDITDWHEFLHHNIGGEEHGIPELADYLEEFLPVPEVPI